MQSTATLLGINSSSKQVTEFILVGFPGFLHWQHWLSIPLALLLVLAVIANITLITTIYREENLHEPMCYFLCYLALVDLPLSMVATPKLLAILLFGSQSISLPGCFAQMFFAHLLVISESGVIVAMAFDRYIAICSPLRYTTILNNRLVVKFLVVITIRSFFCSLPVIVLDAQLNFCLDHIIKNPFCTNLAVTKLACEDITVNSIYQTTMLYLILGVDLALIFLSYCLILHAVSKITAEGAIRKALSTCSSHLILILISYSIIFVLAITHSSQSELMTNIVFVLNVLLLLAPPALNPIVYGIRNKNINQGIRRLFRNRCNWS